MSNKIKQSDWEWFGNAAHFICSSKCQFHLATRVGKYLISTVGELWSDRPVREIHASVYDPEWLEENKHLKGDYFDAAYMKKFGFEDIGCDRKFETMVFEAGERCECGCGLPRISGSELEMNGYNDAKSARDGHMKLCEKWANQNG